MELRNPEFVKTAIKPQDYPVLNLPEFALAGRSNVGKSSLLNNLFQRKKLVKTSSTPGKTQAINFFKTDELVFVDLPGYGFANVPISVRAQWGPMIQSYLEYREALLGVIFLFDIRRLPNEEDQQLIEWADYYDIPLILVLTKVDKVKRNEKGIVFFTNYGSRKGHDLEENPNASIAVYWKELERQVCIDGKVIKVSHEESEKYFAKRPRGSQISAWASKQGDPLRSRHELEEAYAHFEKQYDGKDIPLPPYWGGFCLVPERIEFWQGRPDRLHDRFSYTQEQGSWKIERLSP